MKLDVLPEVGMVLIGHPKLADVIELYTQRRGLNYMLSEWMPEDKTYLIDCAAMFSLTDEGMRTFEEQRLGVGASPLYGEGMVCRNCGGVMMRTGSCHTCIQCGESNGCG